jgi:transaldolase
MEHARKLDLLDAAGVSFWLDDLSRERLADGWLKDLVAVRHLKGITTNPSIFAKNVAGSDVYDAQLAELKAAGASAAAAVRAITVQDVQDAADLLRGVYDATDGVDGYVSLEVDPRLARDTDATVAEAAELWAAVDRPNLMIKIPGTAEGLPAVRRTLAAGINVNVTLIFGRQRYAEVVEAFYAGLEDAKAAGQDISRIASVASFFISRIDTAADRELDALGTPEAAALKAKVALSNARLAYHQHLADLESDRWKALAAAGARPQRPLWASTGMKGAGLPPAAYVSQLVAPGVVNTIPPHTLEDVIVYHGGFNDTITPVRKKAQTVIDDLAGLGISLDDITAKLEADGVDAFVTSWEDLLATVEKKLA